MGNERSSCWPSHYSSLIISSFNFTLNRGLFGQGEDDGRRAKKTLKPEIVEIDWTPFETGFPIWVSGSILSCYGCIHSLLCVFLCLCDEMELLCSLMADCVVFSKEKFSCKCVWSCFQWVQFPYPISQGTYPTDRFVHSFWRWEINGSYSRVVANV